MIPLREPRRSPKRWTVGMPFAVGLAFAVALSTSACGGSGTEPDQLAYRITSESAESGDAVEVDRGNTGQGNTGQGNTDEGNTAAWSSFADQRAVVDEAAEARFQEAIEALGQSYTFHSRVGSAADDPVEVTGQRVGDAVSYRLIAGGAAVEVVDLGDAIWTRVGDGPWELAESGADDDPLLALARPLNVVAGAEADRLTATYEPSTLGFDGTDPLPVEVRIQGGSVTFAATTEDGLSLLSALVAAPELEPIAAPE